MKITLSELGLCALLVGVPGAGTGLKSAPRTIDAQAPYGPIAQ